MTTRANPVAMNHWVGLALVVFTLGCGGDGLKEYHCVEGRFQILLPGEPVTPPEVPKGTHKIRLMLRSGSFAIAWTDLSESEIKDPQARLDKACDTALAGLKAQPISRKAYLYAGKFPAREFLVELSKRGNRVQTRILLAGTRLYHVMASGERWWVESASTQRVLDSFALLEPEE